MLSPFAVILRPSPVILSEAKNPSSLLRVNSAKHPINSSPGAKRKRQLQRFFALTSQGSE
jgi:hypothetical protein